VLGWGRAILLQLAHPLIAAGVYDHSSFRRGPWTAVARLHATIRSMLTLTFGTDAEQQHVLHIIRSIHRRVHGHLPETVGRFPAGERYSAENADLVLWVHLTLLESLPLTYEQLVAPLTAAERDTYCDEAAWVATALGARAEEVPHTWDAMREQLARFYASGAIAVGPQARVLAPLILAPRATLLVPPLAWANRLMTIGWLPEDIRAQYGLTWDARRQRQLDRVIPVVRQTRRALPDALALWRDARR
jgi:uncharacterized protein (DUF2236 family)